MKLPKVVIFDVGGTLINNHSFDNFDLGYRYLYEEVLDVKETYSSFMEFIRELTSIIKERELVSLEFSFRSLFNYLVLVYGVKTDIAYEEIEQNFLDQFYSYEIVPHVVELLTYLKEKGVKLLVFSNSMYSTHQIKQELKNVGILDYFESVASSADYLVRKPSDKVFKLYLKKFELETNQRSDICYIGNMLKYDIEPATKLGLLSIYKSNQFLKHQEFLEISNYLELINEFEKDK